MNEEMANRVKRCHIAKRLLYQKRLKEAGFDDESDLVDVSFHIEGFECTSCFSKIEEAIRKLDDVEITNIEFVAKVTVKFDRSKVLVTDISEVARNPLGYNSYVKRLVF